MKENLVTEPVVCNELTIPQLDNIVNGTENLVDLCNLKDVYCHTQVVSVFFVFFIFKLDTVAVFPFEIANDGMPAKKNREITGKQSYFCNITFL
jgi:hypothetical protein